MSSSPKAQALILDPGTYEILLGIAGEDEPHFIEPTVYVDTNDSILPNSILPVLSEMARERFFGRDALRYKSVLKLHYMLEEHDFASFGLLLKRILEENFLDPHDLNIVVIESPRLTVVTKQKLQNLLFHFLQVPKIAFLSNASCVLTALGKDTGVLVDIGHLGTNVESIFKNFPNPDSRFDIPIGGYHITQRLVELMFSRIQYESTMPLYWIAEDIKRASVYIALDPKQEEEKIILGQANINQQIEFPDGTLITINKERFNCAEPLFEPELAHIRSEGLIEIVDKSIRIWDRSQIPDFLKNIILCGNGAKLPGLTTRIEALLKEKFARTLAVEVVPVQEYKKAAWIGASILYMKRNGQLDWINNPEREA